MITFELISLFTRRKWYWLSFCSLWLVFSVMAKFLVGPAIRAGEVVSVWDFMIASLTQKFLSIVLVPILFLLLIADLIIRDFNDGYLGYIMNRVSRRTTWFIAKSIALFSASFLFTAIIGVFLFIAGVIWQIPLVNSLHHPLGAFAQQLRLVPAYMPFTMLSFCVIGLTAFGMFILTLSMFVRNSTILLGIGLFLAVLSYGTYIYYPQLAMYLPTTHLKFDHHAPFNPHKHAITLTWSFVYAIILFSVSFLVGLFKSRTMNLTRKT